MSRSIVNTDNRLYDSLIQLKRHLLSCRDCRVARKSNLPQDMCNAGIRLVWEVAGYYDVIISLRIEAHNNPGQTVFPCPKLSAHGKSYELTAVPLAVTGVMDRLF